MSDQTNTWKKMKKKGKEAYTVPQYLHSKLLDLLMFNLKLIDKNFLWLN